MIKNNYIELVKTDNLDIFNIQERREKIISNKYPKKDILKYIHERITEEISLFSGEQMNKKFIDILIFKLENMLFFEQSNYIINWFDISIIKIRNMDLKEVVKTQKMDINDDSLSMFLYKHMSILKIKVDLFTGYKRSIFVIFDLYSYNIHIIPEIENISQ